MLLQTASIFSDFWQHQIVQHDRQGTFLVLVSFLASFLFIRTSARLGRSTTWWPGSVVTDSGVHLHHLVWGISLLMVSGFLAYSLRFESPWWEVTAVLFGIGMGLTLDEFALWVYLKDVYWAEQGRKSLDAVAIATVFMVVVVIGSRPFEFEEPGPVLGAAGWIVVVLILCTISFLKERLIYGMLGLFVPLFSIIGASRLGRPGSPWAKWRYGKKNQKKQERAQERFDDMDKRTNRWKLKLFNAIGGKPTDELQNKKLDEEEQRAQEDAIKEVRHRAEQQAAAEAKQD